MGGNNQENTKKPSEAELAVQKGCTVGCLGIIILFVIALVWTSITGMPSPTPSQSQPQQQSQTKAWYQGGTLHKATDADWLAASAANRLATASDFVATQKEAFGLSNATSMEQYRGPSEQLSACITEAAKARAGQTVISLGVACVVLLTK